METDNDRTIAVFICTENELLERSLNIEDIERMLLGEEDIVDVFVNREICSREGMEAILERFREVSPSRVLLVGSTPTVASKIRDILVGKGLNSYLFEQVNLKEMCYNAKGDRSAATRMAKSILLGGIARLRSAVPLTDLDIPIQGSVLVIGGGVAGMASALEIADAGFKVYLVEREEELGGRSYHLTTTFPTHECGICCMRYCKECVLTPKIPEVHSHPNIEVMLKAQVVDISGHFGSRHVVVDHDGQRKEFDVGVIIVATGSKTFDPTSLPEYGYDELEDVVTSMEFVKIMSEAGEKGFRRPSDGRIPDKVNFVLCVGSRDRHRANPYCSIVCCTYAIGSAKELKQAHPETDVFVHYIDLRGPYRGFETLLDEAKEAGVQLIRGRVAEVIRRDGGVTLRSEDTDLGSILTIDSDLVVLAVGQEPSDGSSELIRMLRLQTDVDGFIMDLNPMFPEEIRKGIYIVGCAVGPKGIRYSIDDAKRAAGEVIRLLSSGRIRVDNYVAEVIEKTCRGCGRCMEACPFEAISLVEKDGYLKAVVNESVCEGCGICSVACCNKSMKMRHYTREGIVSQVQSVIQEVI